MVSLIHKQLECYRMLAGALIAQACLAQSLAADQVLVESNDGSGRMFQLQGTILDYTGKQLTLETVSGNRRVIPSMRVLQVFTDRQSAEMLGDAALANHDWSTAARHFLAAHSAEQRTWARRLILAKLLVSHRNLGKYDAAGALFLRLVKSDPQTPAYRHMPLAWTAADLASSKQARQWLAQTKSPAAVVLGASHLMSTTARPTALRALANVRRQLTDYPELAALADAQIWRAQHAELTLAMVDRWARRVEAFPETVRAGPYYVVANSYERLDQVDRAELYYLRIPVLYPNARLLASRALTAAARLADRAGHPDETRTLLEEVVARYEETPERALAEQQLKKLAPVDEWIGK